MQGARSFFAIVNQGVAHAHRVATIQCGLRVWLERACLANFVGALFLMAICHEFLLSHVWQQALKNTRIANVVSQRVMLMATSEHPSDSFDFSWTLWPSG